LVVEPAPLGTFLKGRPYFLHLNIKSPHPCQPRSKPPNERAQQISLFISTYPFAKHYDEKIVLAKGFAQH